PSLSHLGVDTQELIRRRVVVALDEVHEPVRVGVRTLESERSAARATRRGNPERAVAQGLLKGVARSKEITHATWIAGQVLTRIRREVYLLDRSGCWSVD